MPRRPNGPDAPVEAEPDHMQRDVDAAPDAAPSTLDAEPWPGAAEASAGEPESEPELAEGIPEVEPEPEIAEPFPEIEPESEPGSAIAEAVFEMEPEPEAAEPLPAVEPEPDVAEPSPAIEPEVTAVSPEMELPPEMADPAAGFEAPPDAAPHDPDELGDPAWAAGGRRRRRRDDLFDDDDFDDVGEPAAPPPQPYADDTEHLVAELEACEAWLRLYVIRARMAAEGDPARRGLFIGPDELDAALARPPGSPLWSVIDDEELEADGEVVEAMLAEVDVRAAATREAGRPLRLLELVDLHGLTPLDRRIVLLCLLAEFDGPVERLFGWLHDDVTRRRPSVGLVLDLFAPALADRFTVRQRFAPDAPLMRWDLVRLAGDAELPLRRPVHASPAVVAWLTGGVPLDGEYGDRLDRLPPALDPGALVWPAALRRTHERLLMSPPSLLVVHGAEGSGRRTFAHALASAWHRPAYRLDLDGAEGLPPDELRDMIAAACDAARLEDAVLCVVVGQPAPGAPDLRPMVLEAMGERGPARNAIATDVAWHPDATPDAIHAIVQVGIPAPDAADRRRLWRRAVPELSEAALDRVADAFRFTPARIRAAGATARGLAADRDAWAPELADVIAAGRAHAIPRLSTLAQEVTTSLGWDDLVLDEGRKALLRGIADRVVHAPRVLGEWGFAERLADARGVAALFTGPPGTGKTMSAALLAKQAGRSLYRIDLSQVVSKYVGETEKHLERVFAEAEATNVALFFDEADALFGKRTELKDAHDRYANIEVAYLLQRLERFDGITILASNLRKNMDDAFIRRLDFIIDFPVPGVAQRAAIWRRIWPAALPLGPGVDPDDLARRFAISGGYIRNIALAAAFASAAAGTPVTMARVLAAAKVEFQKMNRLVDSRQFALPAVGDG